MVVSMFAGYGMRAWAENAGTPAKWAIRDIALHSSDFMHGGYLHSSNSINAQNAHSSQFVGDDAEGCCARAPCDNGITRDKEAPMVTTYNPSALLPFGAGFMFVGLIFILVGGFLLWRDRKLAARCTASTVGEVTRMIRHVDRDSDGTSVTWSPEVAYQVGGVEYTVSSSISKGRPSAHVGDRMTVGYDPYDPATAYLPEEKSESFCRLFIIIGVVTFAIGAAAAIAWLFV